MADLRPNSSKPRHKRPLFVASFAVLVVLTSVAFATTGAGYFASEKAEGDMIEGTVLAYSLDESADTPVVVAEVDIENPTKRPVTLDSVNVDGSVDGATLARGSSTVDGTVPPGETKTVTIQLRPVADHEEDVVAAVESDSLTVAGTMAARIEQYRFQIHVQTDSQSAEGVFA